MALAAQLIGAALLLVAFLGLGRLWGLVSVSYLILNIVGSALLAAAAVATHAWGFVVLEVVWCLAALRSLGSVLGRNLEG